MSGPTSSPPSGVPRRIIASPRNAQDLKLRLASVDENRSGLYALGLVSPLTDLMSSSPSQLQPLTPALNGRPSNGANSSWTLSSNLLSNSNRTASSPHTSSSKGKGPPPALDIVSPIAAGAHGSGSVGVHGRSSLPDIAARKDPQLSSVDVSAERCTLSPSSAGGGRSTAFTPTCEASNNTSVAQQRASTSTFCEMVTPPPNAPRSYSKRTGGSRDSVPPPRPSLGSGLRTAAPSMNLESPTRHGGNSDEPSPMRRVRHNTDGGSGAAARAGDVSIDYDAPRGGPHTSDYATYPSHTPTAGQAAAAAASRAPVLSPASSPSAPASPATGTRGRTAQMESILATSAQNTGATNSFTAGGSGFNSTHTSSHTPSNRSQNVRGRSARAPHLASHLFLDSATQDSGTPASGLQSPALTEARRRGGSRSSSGRGRSRSSRGSSEGRVSISTEGSNTFLTPVLSTARPNALNFARGELIGKGSFGAVYRGMQRNTNQIICMKEIRLPGVVEELRKLQNKPSLDEGTSPRGGTSTPPPPPTPPPTAITDEKEKAALLKEMDGVQRELALLKQLNHPNIVKYLNDEIVDGHLRIYMEYVSGGSVASAVKTYGSFQEPQAAALCYQLLQGLSYLHSHGIVHRDLKGDNLLLETSSALKIADFGTAKNIIASATMTANIVGTAYFMAPEVLRPDGLAGTPADIWSTGCCVIEMLTGKPPLSDIPNQYSVMMTIAGSPKVPLEKYIPPDNTWSPSVLDFIKQCLRLNAATRPTAQELLRHPWILQYCESEVVVAAATPATAASSPTPTLAPMDSPNRSPAAAAAAAAGRRARQPDPPLTPSSDAVRIATAATPTVSPRPPTRCGSAEPQREASTAPNSAVREKRSKREKKSTLSTRRQHGARDPNVDPHNCGVSSSRDESTTSKTTNATPSPPPVVAGTMPTTENTRVALTRPTADLFGKTHYLGVPSNLSTKDDDRHQSFSYEYQLPSPGRVAELSLQASGNFLPAIPGALSNSAAPPASLTASVDGLRAHRLTRHPNVCSSRDDTRAYHYPNEDDCTSRGSMRGGGRDFFLDAQDYGRDVADGLAQYGSTARMQLPDAGLEPGLYSTLDCLTAPPGAEELPPSTTSRRSTSKRPTGRGTL